MYAKERNGNMFGKKKNIKAKAIHYEGILEFAQNAPCEIEVKEDTFEIKRIKPETFVKLPMDRIIKFEYLSEYDFMSKYHNTTIEIQKGQIMKSFLVITYTAKDNTTKRLAFWEVGINAMKFIDIQKKYTRDVEDITL